ncbi:MULTISPECIES: hypothetical protein [Spirulina sp. CCY15215]|uniref:hypothetical protein n=1 Tax=Spirulina sp. CCY15215 TaxID=2767591 RepID=UPI001951F331|nr:hypothetical protein [Spirulina major]
MAKLPPDLLETLFNLLKQLSELVDEATTTEYLLFERFGETDETIGSLEELKGVALDAASRYRQLCTLRLRIAESQPNLSKDMLKLLESTIVKNQLKIPAMERSIEEIKVEWSL